MKNPIWTNAIKTCADAQRAKHFFDLLAATSAGEALQASLAEQARVLAAGPHAVERIAHVPGLDRLRHAALVAQGREDPQELAPQSLGLLCRSRRKHGAPHGPGAGL